MCTVTVLQYRWITLPGKGANEVISMLPHFFETHGLGERHSHLHSTNCVGKLHNNSHSKIKYFQINNKIHKFSTYWSTRLYIVISPPSLSFQLQFFLDWCFGPFKQKYRRTKVDCLIDIHHLTWASSWGQQHPVNCYPGWRDDCEVRWLVELSYPTFLKFLE